MESNDMRVILIGAGGFGQVAWDLSHASIGARVVAAVDTNSAALSAARAAIGLDGSAIFSDLHEALETVEADVLVDCTPPEFHAMNALAAFHHGLHVFTAKPMAASWEDAVRMVQAAEEASLVLGVNEQLRFGWLPLAVAHVLQIGQIGTLESVQVSFREPSAWSGWRAAMEHPLLLDGAIQHFDMVRAVTGLDVESVFCRTWKRERSSLKGFGSAAAVFELSGGIPFSYVGSWDVTSEAADCTGWWGEWRIQGSVSELRAAGRTGLWIGGVRSPVTVEPLDVKRLSLIVFDQFLRAIREGAPMATDGVADLKTFNMTEMCIRSASIGARVHISDLKPPISDSMPAPTDEVEVEPPMEHAGEEPVGPADGTKVVGMC